MKRLWGFLGILLLSASLAGCGASPPPRTPPVDPTRVDLASLAASPTQLPLPTATASAPAATPTAVASPTAPPASATPLPSTATALPTALKRAIEVPVAAGSVILPLHILARVGTPGDKVTAELRWKDGTLLQREMAVVAGEDGRGLVIDSLGWNTEGQPPQPPTQAATLSLRAADSKVLLQQSQTVLADNDPTTREISLYWAGGDQVYQTKRRIPKTAQIGAATLEELLWGPSPWNLADFKTALPTPDEVLHYQVPHRNWGPRVTLKKLTIVDGVAIADFSQEMRAFSGGAARVGLLRQQITQTLKQFGTIKDVKILIDGEAAGVLEP